jgi:hypothetical protein
MFLGGSAMFNPRGRYYQSLKRVADAEYEDNYWAEDIFSWSVIVTTLYPASRAITLRLSVITSSTSSS